MDIQDLAWQHASTLTDEAEKRKVLEWFIERVRTGKTVNPGVMEFIAAGVEQHLAGKKPWGAKRGVKKKTLHEAFTRYAKYQSIGREHLKEGKPFDPLVVLTYAAEELNISEDTMRRAIDAVQRAMNTHDGKQAQFLWTIEQALKQLENETSRD